MKIIMPKESTVSKIFPLRKSDIESNGKQTLTGKPTPLDFDAFLPWLCLQWEVPEIIVVARVNPEKSKKSDRKLSSKSGKIRIKENGEQESDIAKTLINAEAAAVPVTNTAKKPTIENLSFFGDHITLKAIYDIRGHLVEVAIINSPFIIHRKVIQAINVCVPFHAFLTKLVIRENGLSFTTLCEISKLLPHSNLTHVCLDDTHVPEGNYFVLLDHTSQLKCLSLNRCSINDAVCKEIAVRINLDKPAYWSLMVLELSTNLITDVGAQAFGDVLRTNRRLLHLNLTGNKITDVGAKAILKHLMEFEIFIEDFRLSKSRTKAFEEKRKMVLDKCIDDVINQNNEATTSNLSVRRSRSTQFKSTKSFVNIIEHQSVLEQAEAMTKEIMGEFEDPFKSKNVVKKDTKYFSMGNTTFCSLNLSYNDLEYSTVKMIAEVLEYQSRMVKPERINGLLRIVIDGNKIPDSCPEYRTIDICLKKLVNENLPARSHRKHSLTFTKKNV